VTAAPDKLVVDAAREQEERERVANPADTLGRGRRLYGRRARPGAHGGARWPAARGGIGEAFEMTATPPDDHVCLWCGREFTARCDGGKAQRFCRPACRRAFHAAARTWALDAIASGRLTVAEIRNGPPAPRALPPAGISPAPVLLLPPQQPPLHSLGDGPRDEAPERSIRGP
jgi:hypothetical protein